MLIRPVHSTIKQILVRDRYQLSIIWAAVTSDRTIQTSTMTTTTTTENRELLVAEAKDRERASAAGKLPAEIGTDYDFKRDIVWKNALGFLALHLAGLYGLYLLFHVQRATFLWTIIVALSSGEGVTVGAHRLYSHKSFKATFALRLALILLQTIAGQNCLYIWVRDHRQHHKFSDTDADPHNANRGFFFSHVGWLMARKHPAVIEKGRTIDMSDLEADPLVMFQKEFYKSLYVVLAIALPVAVPVYFWNETYINSFFVCYMFRNILVLNITWLVNSAAHLYGTKPFDRFIMPTESTFVGFVALGEGWHNYHHSFPWDYRAAELGSKYCLTTYVIDFLSYFGLAYDLKSAPYTMIEKRVHRTGDGSHHVYGFKEIRMGEISNGPVDGYDENKYKVEENIVGKGKISLPEVSQRMVAVQG